VYECNSIFLSLFEYINKLLLVDDEALSNNIYEAKKFLHDMKFKYEKYLTYQNDCILF
jgi:hypothetical protein